MHTETASGLMSFKGISAIEALCTVHWLRLSQGRREVFVSQRQRDRDTSALYRKYIEPCYFS